MESEIMTAGKEPVVFIFIDFKQDEE